MSAKGDTSKTHPDPELAAMSRVHEALVDLPAAQQQRVVDWLIRKLGLEGVESLVPREGVSMQAPRATAVNTSSAKAFLAEKGPKSDVERVACLGYYLAHFRATSQFKTKDLTTLNTEAQQPKLGNPAMAVANATKQNQFLSPVGSGRKQITVRGEALVEALPDREKVREALEKVPMRGRRGKTKKQSGKAKARKAT